MGKSILQTNLSKLMKARGFTMKSLSLAAALNETAVRDIINGRVKNPTYKTLDKLAQVLGCQVEELARVPNINVGAEEDYYKQKILSPLATDIFIKSILKVDELILKTKARLSAEDRARAYIAWYELSLLNNDFLKDDAVSEARFNAILKFTKK